MAIMPRCCGSGEENGGMKMKILNAENVEDD